ncbi:MAG: DNA repair exonuclease [Clostridiales bacterium]|nr:DNA repair exonuclease [Clostridiales bacterium]
MKFIHCADLHLDSKMDKLSLDKAKVRRAEMVRTFENLCDYATANNVRAVIIAGDMFDTAKVTVKTRNAVLYAIENNPQVDFLYLAGNHDEDNFISSLEIIPENLKVFGEEWTAFKYGNVCIAGVKFTPYNVNAIYDTINFDPYSVNIAVMHGQIAGYKGEEKAEIISLPRLKNKNVDYLALGHIHEHVEGQLDLRGKYAYSGCLEGRGFDETGDKGFILIDVIEDRLSSQFVKFALRQISVFEYSVEGKLDYLTVRAEIINTLNASFEVSSLIKVVLKGERKADFGIDVDDLTYRLNQIFFYAKVVDKTTIVIKETDYALDKSMRGEFVRAVWESNLSLEDKTKVLTVGLNALKGEDL